MHEQKRPGATINDPRLMGGDVVIWSTAGRFRCQVAIVLYDGESCASLSERWRSRTIADAEPFARDWVRHTGGRTWTWDGVAPPSLR